MAKTENFQPRISWQQSINTIDYKIKYENVVSALSWAKKEIKELEAENFALMHEVNHFKAEIMKLREKNKSHASKIGTLSSQVKHWKKKAAELAIQLAVYKVNADDDNKKYNELKEKYDALLFENEKLQIQLGQNVTAFFMNDIFNNDDDTEHEEQTDEEEQN